MTDGDSSTGLPLGKSFTREVLESEFVQIKDAPFGNASLAYNILLPRSWGHDVIKAESAELPADAPQPLALFGGMQQHGSTPVIQLHGIRLIRDIRAAHWLRLYAERRNAEIVEINELSQLFADSLMVQEIENRKYLMRSAVRIEANQLVLILCMAVSPAYAGLAETFGLAVSSFSLTQAGGVSAIEERSLHTLQGQLEFTAPASWQGDKPADQPNGRQAIDLYNLDAQEVLQGLIRVKTLSKSVPEASRVMARELSLEEFTEAGVRITDVVKAGPVPIKGDRFSNAELTLFNAELGEQGNLQELWLCQMETEDFHLLVALLTPARKTAFETWAVNKRALEIVLETFR